MSTSRVMRAIVALTIALTMLGTIAVHTDTPNASAAPRAAASTQSTPVVIRGESTQPSHGNGRGTIEIQ